MHFCSGQIVNQDQQRRFAVLPASSQAGTEWDETRRVLTISTTLTLQQPVADDKSVAESDVPELDMKQRSSAGEVGLRTSLVPLLSGINLRGWFISMWECNRIGDQLHARPVTVASQGNTS